MAIDFATLWANYPVESRADLFDRLGGGWPALIDQPGYQNTCTLRLSVGMASVGQKPPQDLINADGNMHDGSGHGLIIRVVSARQWLERLLGPSTWGTTKELGADIESLIPDWTGILLYRVPGATDASGHVDLWNKNACRVDCHSNFARQATSVELWRLA